MAGEADTERTDPQGFPDSTAGTGSEKKNQMCAPFPERERSTAGVMPKETQVSRNADTSPSRGRHSVRGTLFLLMRNSCPIRINGPFPRAGALHSGGNAEGNAGFPKRGHVLLPEFFIKIHCQKPGAVVLQHGVDSYHIPAEFVFSHQVRSDHLRSQRIQVL
mgnify:CR=1 FL=1